MKITHVEARPLGVPVDPPLRWGSMEVSVHGGVVVRVHTDEGIVGIGEAGLSAAYFTAVNAVLEEQLVPLLVGADPLMVGQLWKTMFDATHKWGRRGIETYALSGVDIALWDILGKVAGQPVHRLLGTQRQEIRAYFAPSLKRRSDLIPELERAADEGFLAIKVRAGLGVVEDLSTVELAREILGDDVQVMVDANMRFDRHTALILARELEDLGVDWLEEPIRTDSRGNPALGLPPDLPTLPQGLRDAGYATALIGKWHLGYPPDFGPLRSGYDEYFGIMAGGVDYFTHCAPDGQHDLFEGEAPQQEVGYLTDLLSERAVQYVQRQAPAARAGRPFFLSLHYTAPHWPWETRDDESLAAEVASNLFHLHGGSVETYRRMIHHMDEGIGRLFDALDAEGIGRDTLVVFTSDNGGERFSDNWPLVGGKMDLTEGGIRVPWIARWPAAIPAAGRSAQHCMTMDWSTTLLEVGGGTPSSEYPPDGVSLEAVLRNPHATFERPLFWRMNHRSQRAHRCANWKYLMVDGHEYLFDLSRDGRERANLAVHEPVRLAAMRDAWSEWNACMPPIPPGATISVGFSAKDMPQR